MAGFTGQPFGIEYEGLAELGRALKETESELLPVLKTELFEVGEIVAEDTSRRILQQFPTAKKTASHIGIRERLGGSGSIVMTVGQDLRKTTGKRPDWGAYQYGQLVASYSENSYAIEKKVEDGIVVLLRENGF